MSTREIQEHAKLAKAARLKAPKGPWTDEPDRLNWKSAQGFDCMAIRHPSSLHWCGYVGVTKQHPYFGKDYNDCRVDAHGGLTFSEGCSGHICHEAKEEVWWLGFDCAHFGDQCPAYVGKDFFLADGVYRTLEYVKAECESLARQLYEIQQS